MSAARREQGYNESRAAVCLSVVCLCRAAINPAVAAARSSSRTASLCLAGEWHRLTISRFVTTMKRLDVFFLFSLDGEFFLGEILR